MKALGAKLEPPVAKLETRGPKLEAHGPKLKAPGPKLEPLIDRGGGTKIILADLSNF